MINFGFSAFLKLVSLSERRQRTEIRTRLGRRGGGYDFHRSLKLLCSRYADGRLNLEQALATADAISRLPERRSAKAGLEAYARWRGETALAPSFPQAIYESPAARFKVTFTPDFCQRIDGRITAAHLWNTVAPHLDHRMVYIALHFAADAYSELTPSPQDLAVLDLRTESLIRLSDATVPAETAYLFAVRLDELIDDVEHVMEEALERPADHPPHRR